MKKKYLNKVRMHSEDVLKNGGTCKFFFAEDRFGYSDHRQKAEYIWNLMTEFKVVEDTLLMKLKYAESYDLAISKDEVGEETFQKVVSFVATKIKRN